MENLVTLNFTLLWGLAFVELVLLVGLARRMRTLSPLPQNLPSLEAGQPAPGFSATTAGGELRTLDDFAGRGLALVFLSPYCPSCRRVPEDLRRLLPAVEAAGARLRVICDARMDDPEAREFVTEVARGLEVLLAPRGENSAFADYMVLATPSFTLVDAEGRVRAGGPLDGSNLAHAVGTFFRRGRSAGKEGVVGETGRAPAAG